MTPATPYASPFTPKALAVCAANWHVDNKGMPTNKCCVGCPLSTECRDIFTHDHGTTQHDQAVAAYNAKAEAVTS